MAKSKKASSVLHELRSYGCFKVYRDDTSCFACPCEQCREARARRALSPADYKIMSCKHIQGLAFELARPDTAVVTINGHRFVTPVVTHTLNGYYTDELHGLVFYSSQLPTLISSWEHVGPWMTRTREWTALRALFEVAGVWSAAADGVVQEMMKRRP